MHKFFFAAILWLALAGGTSAQSQLIVSRVLFHKTIQGLSVTMPVGRTQPDDPQLKNLVWHKWSSGRFTVLSLDESQGRYVLENIEKMKSWTLSRWGLPDVQFSAECRILCVPSKQLMKKLFGLNESHGEVRRDSSGRINLSVLWLVLDGTPAEAIPAPLTMVALRELEMQRGMKFGWWVHRGMGVLNETVPQIKAEFASVGNRIQRDNLIFSSGALFTLTEKQWIGESEERRDLFDQQAAMVCLLFRKEFGQANLMRFMRTGSSEANLNRVYGFRSFSQFDATMKRYMHHLSNDINQNKTPVHYLQIKPVSNSGRK